MLSFSSTPDNPGQLDTATVKRSFTLVTTPRIDSRLKKVWAVISLLGSTSYFISPQYFSTYVAYFVMSLVVSLPINNIRRYWQDIRHGYDSHPYLRLFGTLLSYSLAILGGYYFATSALLLSLARAFDWYNNVNFATTVLIGFAATLFSRGDNMLLTYTLSICAVGLLGTLLGVAGLSGVLFHPMIDAGVGFALFFGFIGNFISDKLIDMLSRQRADFFELNDEPNELDKQQAEILKIKPQAFLNFRRTIIRMIKNTKNLDSVRDSKKLNIPNEEVQQLVQKVRPKVQLLNLLNLLCTAKPEQAKILIYLLRKSRDVLLDPTLEFDPVLVCDKATTEAETLLLKRSAQLQFTFLITALSYQHLEAPKKADLALTEIDSSMEQFIEESDEIQTGRLHLC